MLINISINRNLNCSKRIIRSFFMARLAKSYTVLNIPKSNTRLGFFKYFNGKGINKISERSEMMSRQSTSPDLAFSACKKVSFHNSSLPFFILSRTFNFINKWCNASFPPSVFGSGGLPFQGNTKFFSSFFRMCNPDIPWSMTLGKRELFLRHCYGSFIGCFTSPATKMQFIDLQSITMHRICLTATATIYKNFSITRTICAFNKFISAFATPLGFGISTNPTFTVYTSFHNKTAQAVKRPSSLASKITLYASPHNILSISPLI